MTDKLSKAEKRRRRQEEKAQARKAKSVKLSSNAENLGTKTVKIAPIPELNVKTVKVQEEPSRAKSVYITSEETFSNACNLTWCTTMSDLEGEWSWQEQRCWTEEEWQTQILPNFSLLEKSTWSEILFEQKTPAKGNKSVPKHHHQELTTLIQEAQDRWIEIGLEEYDTAFRFRFTGTIRAWGIKLQGHFYLIWWERYHKIYPV
ncbi:MAG: hypothetical protein F6J96_09720 [Symploca sp. SIO1C2]|nr:hypothetical protein [Symploca sp. SIO1C2]NER45359.1 hypothetical protein [Symploca sp. SIO1A3]